MPLPGGALDVTLPAVDCDDPSSHDGHDWVDEYDNRWHCIGTED